MALIFHSLSELFKRNVRAVIETLLTRRTRVMLVKIFVRCQQILNNSGCVSPSHVHRLPCVWIMNDKQTDEIQNIAKVFVRRNASILTHVSDDGNRLAFELAKSVFESIGAVALNVDSVEITLTAHVSWPG